MATLMHILELLAKERDGTLTEEERKTIKECEPQVQELKEILEA